MTDAVNDPHVAELLGRLFERMHRIFTDPAWDGVRTSHVRILESLDRDGSRATTVARELRMTKQGAGQLVSTLVAQGLVEQRTDPDDRRAKVLVRTDAGDAVVQRVHRELAALEREWAAEVGAADYAAFRSVLDRVARPGRAAVSAARTGGG